MKVLPHFTVFAYPDGLLDERLRGQQVLPTTRTDPTKPNPKSGTVQLDWNKDGSYLLARFGTLTCWPYLHIATENYIPAARRTCTSVCFPVCFSRPGAISVVPYPFPGPICTKVAISPAALKTGATRTLEPASQGQFGALLR
jgi:hypothetical protein